MKYSIITYGCQMNKSDSERIATVLEKTGYKSASNIKEADLIVVNMCSVRQSAVDRVFGKSQKFKKLKAQNPKLKTILTGCILKSDKKKFRKNFDLILNIKNLAIWPKILKKEKNSLIRPWQINKSNYLKIMPKYETNFQAFIPISNGCNNFCSYCVVPFVRGSLVCRDHKEILKEVRNVVEKGLNPIRNAISNGAREIWLLGQNVNDYQSPADSSINFPKLLKMVNEIEENFWIRFTSPHPLDFSDELIETMAKCEKATPYLNLPVQSGDNEILKRMNRPYTVLQYKNLVKRIRMAFKKYRKGLEREIALSTDIIVGFPGETKKQFQNTVKLFREIKFDMAYIAQYSSRPQTAAFKLKDNIPHKEKERRDKVLTEVLKQTALENNRKYIGKEVTVLVENKKDDFLFGKTKTYKTVKLSNTHYSLLTDNIGQFVRVKIIDATSFGLKGELI